MASYIAHLTGKPDQPRFTIIEVAVDRQEIYRKMKTIYSGIKRSSRFGMKVNIS